MEVGEGSAAINSSVSDIGGVILSLGTISTTAVVDMVPRDSITPPISLTEEFMAALPSPTSMVDLVGVPHLQPVGVPVVVPSLWKQMETVP